MAFRLLCDQLCLSSHPPLMPTNHVFLYSGNTELSVLPIILSYCNIKYLLSMYSLLDTHIGKPLYILFTLFDCLVLIKVELAAIKKKQAV